MINVIAELERIGWGFSWAGDDEIRCLCPFHSDQSPSCSINVKKERFRCCTAGCNAKGDVISFLAGALKCTRADAKIDLATRYDLNLDRTIDANLIEGYHNDLWSAGPLLSELYARGLIDDDIRQYRLGTKDGRVTIPIKNSSHLYVNIRLYLPGAPGKDKFRNLKGRGKARLYPIEQLKYDKILIVGGEVKAIAAARQLNKHGIGCITSTLGESNWEPKLTQYFKGKDVAVCYDIDAEGIKSQANTCRHLLSVTAIKTTKLPLDLEKFPKGDINDFVAAGGDMLHVWQAAELFVNTNTKAYENVKPKRVDLAYAMTAPCAGQRLLLTASVSTLDMSPYIIPSKIKVKCTRDTDYCAVCPVYVNTEDYLYDIHPESPIVLEMIAKPKASQLGALKEELEIPRRCEACEFESKDFYNVEDVRISPRLEITDRSADRSMQPAICIGNGVDLNETYDMIGRMHPHPATQQSTLLISKYRKSKDALSSHQPSGDLEIFRPDSWTLQGLKDKLNHIYSDLESNVTRVYGRRPVHMFVDLAYHSPLFLSFEDKKVKGWVEILIMGDSAQGKTETTMNLQRHYKLGTKVECKNASVAGLLGGLQQMGSRWFVSWGIIPTQDKRLVILEELKGTTPEVISKLTDMRSSGIAEIPKIEKRRTHARTRLIALSNPRSDNPVGSYSFGIEAIKELIGSLEDVRRFDACLLVSSDEVSNEIVNEAQESRVKVPHIYTSDLCHNLVLWSWVAEDVIFEEDAKEAILSYASMMSETFCDAIPVVDRGSMRYKLARLAASIAARTYSSDGSKVIVRLCHVEFINELLNEVYSTKLFGYLELTQSIKAASTLTDVNTIRKAILSTPFPKDFVTNLLGRQYIELQDLQDWCSWDRNQAQSLLSVFVRKHAFIRRNRAYTKSSAFITYLKTIDVPNRPDYIAQEADF
jgi:hypothetical protein